MVGPPRDSNTIQYCLVNASHQKNTSSVVGQSLGHDICCLKEKCGQIERIQIHQIPMRSLGTMTTSMSTIPPFFHPAAWLLPIRSHPSARPSLRGLQELQGPDPRSPSSAAGDRRAPVGSSPKERRVVRVGSLKRYDIVDPYGSTATFSEGRTGASWRLLKSSPITFSEGICGSTGYEMIILMHALVQKRSAGEVMLGLVFVG